MSYGLKYTLTFREEIKSLTSNAISPVLYTINIYKSGYSGSTITVVASDNPITLSYKKQDLGSPIIGSELTIGLMSQSNGQYLEFSTAAPLQYYCDVLKSTDGGSTYNTIWSGVNTTDAYTEPYQNAPYPINLKFNCGLGELQFHRYEQSGSLVSGNEQLILTISNCLSFLPYSKNIREIINFRDDFMYDNAGFLEQMYLNDLTYQEVADDGLVHGMMGQKILSNILTSLNCRMYQANNLWFVERIYERVNQTLTYFDYTPLSLFTAPGGSGTPIANIGTGTLGAPIAVSDSTAPRLINGGDWAVTQKKPALLYSVNAQEENQELIVNPYFEANPNNLNANGTPKYWDMGSSLQTIFNSDPTALQVKIVNPYSNDLNKRYGAVFNKNALQQFSNTMQTHNGGYTPFFDTDYYSLGRWRGYGQDYGIHPVRRSGDTYTNPNVYIDPVAGQIKVEINHYYSFRFWATDASAAIQSQTIYPLGGDAWAILNNGGNMGGANLGLIVPFRCMFFDGSGNNWTIVGPTFQSGGWGWTYNAGLESSFGFNYLPLLNSNYPTLGITGQNQPMTCNTIAQMLETSWNNRSGSVGQSMYLNYIATYSVIYPLSSMVSGGGSQILPGFYNFDCCIYPCIFGAVGGNGAGAGIYTQALSGLNHSTFELHEWGVNTCSVQYVENFTNTISSSKFYVTSDYNQRWNEQKINAVYGDFDVAGYPWQFRLQNGLPSSTYHVEGKGNAYFFNNSVSAADPGSGKFSLNNVSPPLATHLYISSTNWDSVSVATWLAGMTNGNSFILSDNSTGLQYNFQVAGAPTSHTTYYDVPVTYISGQQLPIQEVVTLTSVSGSFQNGETIKDLTTGATATLYYFNTFTNTLLISGISGGAFNAGDSLKGLTSLATATLNTIQGDFCFWAYEGGQELGDVLFQNFLTLIGNYRRAIKGKFLNNGNIPFQRSILDEDGTLYVQVGNKCDLKKGTSDIDVEETSAAPPTISKLNTGAGGIKSLDVKLANLGTGVHVITPPPSLGTVSKMSVSSVAVVNRSSLASVSTSAISTKLSYPTH
jgi:hypothetical protein